MQPIPIKVVNVKVYAHFPPTQPLSELILEGASGTYSVGTLTTNVFYNLNLANEGQRVNPLVVHSKYYAVCETESGDTFTTPWMYCTNNSSQPQFGRTVSLGQHTDAMNARVTPVNESEFIKLGPLTNIVVSQPFPSPEPGQITLLVNGTGYLISTKVGTPHEMGVQVDDGEMISPIRQGMTNIMVSGTTQDGHRITQMGDTVVSAGKPLILLHQFVPNSK